MGKFIFHKTPLDGAVVVEPTVFGDHRGFFMETYSEREFFEVGIREKFVQDNHSRSKRGVLRGLHFQTKHPQGKLIRVVSGRVIDVAVDLRRESPTFGKWHLVELSAENKRQFYIPPRFAHGFLTLDEGTEFVYKCTDYFAPEFDGGVLWNDPQIGVEWNLGKYGLTEDDLILSDKDKKQPTLSSLKWEEIF